MKHRTAALALLVALSLSSLAPAVGPAVGPAKAAVPAALPLPAVPGPPAVGPLLLRLAGATGAVMAIGGGAMWGVRRFARRPPVGSGDTRLRLVETLSLGNGTSLHLLECCGRRFVAGVGPTGFRSLAPLPEPFDNELDVLAALG